VEKMRKEYDFSKAIRNPYAKKIKKPVTIRLDEITISYFKKLADEIDVPYQTLINLYLRDCAATNRKLSLKWRPVA
jgi:predicted DNA binding CopG/RHH family protein